MKKSCHCHHAVSKETSPDGYWQQQCSAKQQRHRTNGFINANWFLKTSLDRYSAGVEETSRHHPPTVPHAGAPSKISTQAGRIVARVKDNNNKKKEPKTKTWKAASLVPGVSND